MLRKTVKTKQRQEKKRVLVDEAWMLLPYPEAVDFLNKMARRARKRNVSLAVVSQRFQDFYEKIRSTSCFNIIRYKAIFSTRQIRNTIYKRSISN